MDASEGITLMHELSCSKVVRRRLVLSEENHIFARFVSSSS